MKATKTHTGAARVAEHGCEESQDKIANMLGLIGDQRPYNGEEDLVVILDVRNDEKTPVSPQVVLNIVVLCQYICSLLPTLTNSGPRPYTNAIQAFVAASRVRL